MAAEQLQAAQSAAARAASYTQVWGLLQCATSCRAC